MRGRVIVFTTSRYVEFVENSLKFSYPLYFNDSYGPGFGLSFMVELNGFLTFDPNSFVKISPELNPFRLAYYDPTAFSVVQVADPPSIRELSIYYNGPGRNDSYINVGFAAGYAPYSQRFNMYCQAPFYSQADFTAYVNKYFAKGSTWLGEFGYLTKSFSSDPYG